RRPERRGDGHETPAENGGKPCEKEAPPPAAKCDEPARYGKQRDFGEDADRPQHANHAIGDALRPPIEAAEAVVNGVARLDFARYEAKTPKTRARTKH